MLQAASIKGAEKEGVRRMYLAEVADEVGHAQYLANQIVMLGGTPKMYPDLTPSENNRLRRWSLVGRCCPPPAKKSDKDRG